MWRLKALYQKLMQRHLLSALGIMIMRVFSLGSKFVLALFIVRFIGLADLGIFGLVGGACALVPMALRLGIFSYLARQSVNQTLEELTRNFYAYGTGVFALYSMLFPFVVIAGWYYGDMNLLMLCLTVIIFEHICNDIFVVANNLQQPKLANGLLTLQSSIWIYPFMMLAFFYPSYRTLETVLAFWISGGVITTGIALFCARHWPWVKAMASGTSIAWYQGLIQKSWKIYLAEMISTITIYMDRYLISAFLSLELAGVYILFWQVTNGICNLIGAGVLQVSVPRLITAHQAKDTELFNKYVKEISLRGMGLTYILSFVAGIVVPFMISFTDHAGAMDYLPLLWLMLVALGFRIGGDICAYILYAQHRDGPVLASVIIKLLVGLATGAASLYYIGIYGVIITIAAIGTSAMLYTKSIWKEERHT